MRKRPLIMVVFLLMIFISSYGLTAIVAEPNMVKDFQPASIDWYPDPEWRYRKSISINGSAGAGTNYQIFLNVTHDSDMQADFDDLRFTDDDGTTDLYYWLESYVASTFALVWVNVTDDLGSDQEIFMYYGNSGVSTTSDGEATFLFYEDWNSQTVDAGRWDVVSGDGTVTYSASGSNHGYTAKFVGNAPSSIYHIETDLDSLAPMAIVFRSNIEITDGVNHQRLRQGAGIFVDGCAYVGSVQNVQNFWVTDDDSNDDSQTMSNAYFDSYHIFEITRDGTDAKLYAERNLIETGSCEPDIISNPMVFIYARDTEHALYSDWVFGRKFIAIEPEFDSFGEEENNFSWHIVGNVMLRFFIELDTGALDSLTILLGLIMIPVSTIYLAYGAKHDRSSNRLFYGLIIFFLGCGLFIGGILP